MRPTARKQAEKEDHFPKKNILTMKSHLSKRGKYEFDHVSIDIIDTQSNTSIFCDSWKLVHGHCPLFVLLYANDSFSNKETRTNTDHHTHGIKMRFLKRKSLNMNK